MIVGRVAEARLDHKLILLEGLDDSVGKKVVREEPLVVSSDHDEDLSDEFILSSICCRLCLRA